MHLFCLGISHHTAPVELRERIALSPSAAEAALRDLHARHPGAEAAILSTCNRTEFYVARALHGHPRLEQLTDHFARMCRLSNEQIAQCLYHRGNDQAVHHLFRVACGLDSMVLGENQITAQVRAAYETAQRVGTVGTVLHRVFQSALAAGKQVRSSTGIGEGRLSVGSVAVDFARGLFDTFTDKTLLAIGAGKMTAITLRHFMELQPARLVVCNRSADKAHHLAGDLGGQAVPFDQLAEHLIAADVVVSSTGAAQPIVTAEMVKPLMRQRRFRPLFVIDIAVPRDVEAAVGSINDVYVYNIDDLQAVISENLRLRDGQLDECTAIIEPAAAKCYADVQNQDVHDLIRRLRQRMEEMGQAETERTQNRLRQADPQRAGQILDEHTHRLIGKILHQPLSALDQQPAAQVALLAAALRRLFDLGNEEDLDQPEQPCRTDDDSKPMMSPDAPSP